MIVNDQEKALHMRALAAQFRHAANETMWPRYRTKLLQVAQDLENEAEKLTVQRDPPAPSRGASRAG